MAEIEFSVFARQEPGKPFASKEEVAKVAEQWAEHGRDRVVRPVSRLPQPPYCHRSKVRGRGWDLAENQKREGGQSQLAIHKQGCPNQTQKIIPDNLVFLG
jgi:hypothetical protein